MPIQHSELKTLVDEMAAYNSESAYKKVFDLLFHPVMKFSYGVVKSWELAEEIASDVLFVLWQHRARLAEVKNVKYYAFVAAKNRALNALKQQTGKEAVSLNDIDMDIRLNIPSPEAVFIQGELKAKLERAIASLPTQCKLVFQLVKEEGFSYKEAADMLNISPKTVDAHLVNAIKKLAVVLKSEYKLA